MASDFVRIQELFDAEFALNQKRMGSRMKCGKGCTQCCHHIFTIDEIEARAIGAGMARLPEQIQDALRVAAAKYRRELTDLRQRGLGQPGDGSALACPALDEDGACTIYAARPLICRLFGAPILNEHKQNEVRLCPLNGVPGEEMDAEGLVERQVEMQQRWREHRKQHSSGRRLTVADAILAGAASALAL